MDAERWSSRRRPASRRAASRRTGASAFRALSVGAVVVALFCLVAAALLTGCEARVGPTETVVVDEPLASAAVTDVELILGNGSLSLEPGAVGLASGIIRCNVEEWLPQIKRSDARLAIQQKSRKSISGTAPTTINDWDLMLGRSPMRLKVSAGVLEGSLDLSGLTLLDLNVDAGPSNTLVMFNAVNPGQMERLRLHAGDSTVSIIGLANANFKSMDFKGGEGAYSFDFSGQLRTTAAAKISLGSGTVRIQVPEGMAVTVKVSGSKTEVDTQGSWVSRGSSHSTSAVGTADAGKTLTVDLGMDAGTATLVIR